MSHRDRENEFVPGCWRTLGQQSALDWLGRMRRIGAPTLSEIEADLATQLQQYVRELVGDGVVTPEAIKLAFHRVLDQNHMTVSTTQSAEEGGRDAADEITSSLVPLTSLGELVLLKMREFWRL